MSDPTIPLPPPPPPEVLAQAQRFQQLVACDCWHLVRPLAPDVALPDHVHLETMPWTVLFWQTDNGMPPVEHAWPVSHQGRSLMLVLRQWAFEVKRTSDSDPKPAIAAALEAEPAWITSLECMRVSAQWMKMYLNPEIDDAELRRYWAVVEDMSTRIGLSIANMHDIVNDGTAAQLLRNLGLPDTPPTVRYLWACATGATAPWPQSEGLLVTTLIYGRLPADGEQPGPLGFVEETADVQITGQLSYADHDVMELVGKTVRSHRDWVHARYPPLLTRSKVAKAHTGSYQAATWLPEDLDYYKVATDERTINLIATAIGGGADPIAAIDAALDRVYHYVHKRLLRTKGKKAAEPPKDWRQRARQHLHIEMEARRDKPLAHTVGYSP